MKLAAVRGQQRVVQTLQRSLAAKRVAHAYLFEGPAGCGRRTTALALLQALFCQSPSGDDACGNCPACRKLVAGSHPDIHLLTPLPDKRDISIEQVRELQQMLALRPFEAPRKACLIEPAERMNEKSANALLKTLEEPPGHAVMILLTTQADLLLSTIRSRCQHLRFSPLDDATLTDLLVTQGMARETASELAPLAEGSMERAMSLDGEGDEARRRELLQLLSRAALRQIDTVFDAAEALSGGRDETAATFDLLIALVRDLVLLTTAGHSGVVNLFLLQELIAEAEHFSPEHAMEALELALATRRAVQGNANPKLALEHFFLGYDRLRKGV